MQFTEATIREILYDFALTGEFVSFAPIGCGHINDTLCVTFRDAGTDRHYILQRINTHVFTKPDQLMENVANVTAYLARILRANGCDPDRGTLTVFPTKEGALYHRTDSGECWRVYNYIEGTYTLQTIRDPEDFRVSGEAFGQFQKLLADYPSETLHETIPHFHDTAARFLNFKKAVEADTVGRAHTVQREIDFVLQREADTHVLVDLLRAGELPLRVTHNDTKLNNILFDNETKRGICVVDLSMELYRAYTRGYLSAAGDSLTKKEIEYLPFSAKLMTLECGMRFLTDYLEGDVYFRVAYPDHNLVRCRTQFALVAQMEKQMPQMQAETAAIAATIGKGV